MASKIRTWAVDNLAQILLSGCLLYALTGGAFFIDWTHVSHWKQLVKISSVAAFLIFLVGAVVLYLKNGQGIVAWQPFRAIACFFHLKPAVSVSLFVSAYFLVHIFHQLAMHYGMATYLWDLGFYDQVLWNTARGDFLITSVRGGIHVFAEHFKPIMIFLSGLYQFQGETWVLLVFTTLMTSSSLVAVYLIAKEMTRSHSDALVFVACVFFYQPMAHGIDFLYHTQMLIDPFILFGFYFVLKARLFLAASLFILALACKESAVPDVLGAGIFIFALRKRKAGLIVTVIGLIWLCGYVFGAQPHFVFPGHCKNIWSFYRDWLHPSLKTFSACMQPNPFFYLFKVFGPFLFLSFFCPRWYLPLGPSLLFRLISLDPSLRSTDFHYTGGLDALIFISAIYGFQSITQRLIVPSSNGWWRRTRSFLSDPMVLRIAIVVTAFLFSGRPQLVSTERFLNAASDPGNQKIIRILESIPSQYSVLGSQSLAAHFSHRSKMFVFCSIFSKTPYDDFYKRPDLVVHDAQVDEPCGAGVLNDLIQKGYTPIYSVAHLKIYADPSNPRVDVEGLKVKWKELEKRAIVPYHNIARSVYLAVFFIGIVIILVWSRYTGLTLLTKTT